MSQSDQKLNTDVVNHIMCDHAGQNTHNYC